MSRKGFAAASRKSIPTPVRLEQALVRDGVNPRVAQQFVKNHLESKKRWEEQEKKQKEKLCRAVKSLKNPGCTVEQVKDAASTFIEMFHFEGVKQLLSVVVNERRPLEVRKEALGSLTPLVVNMRIADSQFYKRELNRIARTFEYIVSNSPELESDVEVVTGQINDAIKAHQERYALFCVARKVV